MPCSHVGQRSGSSKSSVQCLFELLNQEVWWAQGKAKGIYRVECFCVLVCLCVCVEGRCLTGWRDTEVVVGIILGVSEEDSWKHLLWERLRPGVWGRVLPPRTSHVRRVELPWTGGKTVGEGGWVTTQPEGRGWSLEGSRLLSERRMVQHTGLGRARREFSGKPLLQSGLAITEKSRLSS